MRNGCQPCQPCSSWADRFGEVTWQRRSRGTGAWLRLLLATERLSGRCWHWCEQTGWKPSVQPDASSLWPQSFWSSLLFSMHKPLSLSLFPSVSPLSLLHSQMSDRRPGIWHTSFCLLSFSNSLLSSPPPFFFFFCSYLHTCMRACTHTHSPSCLSFPDRTHSGTPAVSLGGNLSGNDISPIIP